MSLDPPATDPLLDSCRSVADRARAASRRLATSDASTRDRWLDAVASGLEDRADEVLAANAIDVESAPGGGLSAAAVDRLRLDRGRLAAIARDVRGVAAQGEVLGEVVRSGRRPNGLDVSQVRVPLGVIFMIYESRPNVTVDAAALGVKSGNALILRGGKEAARSNRALHAILADALDAVGLPRDAVQLVPTADRAAVGHLLAMDDRIDLAIPRGGEGLIRRVVAEARMPVLKHYKGVCHVYVDRSADLDLAEAVVVDAKARRPSACNAAETLLVHREVAAEAVPRLVAALRGVGVEVRGDDRARSLVPDLTPATADDWDAEYLDVILALGVVDSLSAAIDHIHRHGSGHTEAILGRDPDACERFVAAVDSSAVMVNASTRFNDGGELGLGAEIGISTDKVHARGPCGLRELTSTKWIVRGAGHVRG